MSNKYLYENQYKRLLSSIKEQLYKALGFMIAGILTTILLFLIRKIITIYPALLLAVISIVMIYDLVKTIDNYKEFYKDYKEIINEEYGESNW